MAASNALNFVIVVSFMGSVILSGIFISTISNIFERRVEKYKKGLLRYHFSDHIILFGYNEMTSHLVKQLHNNPKYKYHTIVIQTAKSVEDARLEFYSMLTPEESSDVIFTYGRRDVEIELRTLRIEKALEVFILGEGYVEDKVEYAHDSLNMDCLNIIGEICNEKRDRKSVV